MLDTLPIQALASRYEQTSMRLLGEPGQAVCPAIDLFDTTPCKRRRHVSPIDPSRRQLPASGNPKLFQHLNGFIDSRRHGLSSFTRRNRSLSEGGIRTEYNEQNVGS